MKQKEVPEMDAVEEIISKISEDSPYKRRPTQKRTWMTVPEMGKLLGLKKTDRYWLVHKNVFESKEIAGKIITWLRKTASTSPDKGMYWANNRSRANAFASPIDTHCLLMAFFNEVSPDKQETDRMKQWLLNQKQTQNWKSVPVSYTHLRAHET